AMAEIEALLARELPDAAQAGLLAQAAARDLPVLRGESVRLGWGARSAPLGDGPPDWERLGRIPLAAVTGTNGKTTTGRLIDHTLRSAGWRTGRTDTDGIWVGGKLLESGDWTGFGGAAAILAHPEVDIAVLETARGGILRRGLAFDRCDVAVVTNVAEDHLPDRGVATVAELARAKAAIVRAVRPDGRAVLNADDPTVVAEVAPDAAAPIIWFSLEAESPLIAAHRQAGGAVLLLRGAELILAEGEAEHVLLAVANLPIALGGLARHNIANALAAAGALHALGLAPGQIVFGLASFQPSPDDNPGRLNRFERDGMAIVLDYAHNADGLRVLLASARPLVAPGGRLLLIYSGTGDRTDEQIREQGAIIGASVDRFIMRRDPYFLRGRPEGEIEPLLRAGTADAGLPPEAIAEVDGDEQALALALAELRPGDVLAFAVHRERQARIDQLRRWERGES
ncbi:MAG TPA: Mur ligase family protein, partial [Herpetosiphonaceae bacterium]